MEIYCKHAINHYQITPTSLSRQMDYWHLIGLLNRDVAVILGESLLIIETFVSESQGVVSGIGFSKVPHTIVWFRLPGAFVGRDGGMPLRP